MFDKEQKQQVKELADSIGTKITMSYLFNTKEEDKKWIVFSDFETEKSFDLAYKYKKGNTYVELVELKTLKQLQKLDLDKLERVLELVREVNNPEEC